jgi:hypothetical protein
MGELKIPERRNDLKLSAPDSVALPRRIARSFGVSGAIRWTACDAQLVGVFTGYNDRTTLADVAAYYGGTSETHVSDEASYDDIRDGADAEYRFRDANPYGIEKVRSAVRHTIPASMALEEGDERMFVLFHDGQRFVIGLLPVEDENAAPEETFRYQYNPMSASPDDPPATLSRTWLDYEKDRVKIHHDSSTDTHYYTFPKQVAAALWLDDSYTSSWVRSGDAHLAELVPGSVTDAHRRADPSLIPS